MKELQFIQLPYIANISSPLDSICCPFSGSLGVSLYRQFHGFVQPLTYHYHKSMSGSDFNQA